MSHRIKKTIAQFAKTTAATMIIVMTTAAPVAYAADETTAFRSLTEVHTGTLQTSTVVEVAVDNSYKKFAITENDIYKPWIVKAKKSDTQFTMSPKAGTEFPVTSNQQNKAEITITSIKPVTSSKLHISLENYVALPSQIEVLAKSGDSYKTVIAQKKMSNTLLTFPETSTNEWKVNIWHTQPLQVSNIDFIPTHSSIKKTHFLRFLAKPNTTYKVYADPDRTIHIPTTESGNLYQDEDVQKLTTPTFAPNPSYKPSDVDQDGVPDLKDNCVHIANTDQTDVNANDRGDVCDDFDKDGITNDKDNCPQEPNRRQSDNDGDGVGDACDEEESRFSENNPWLPWAGMAIAAIAVLSMLAKTIKEK